MLTHTTRWSHAPGQGVVPSPWQATPKWYTVAQVAELLGYGESKVRMLIIQGDLRSLKDGRCRRVLPEWVGAYVAMKASQAEDVWYS
jgi:excisionase family DNA binding protein